MYSIPYLDDLHSSLKERHSIVWFQYVLSCLAADSSFSCWKLAVKICEDHLPGYLDAIEVEFEWWLSKRRTVESPHRLVKCSWNINRTWQQYVANHVSTPKVSIQSTRINCYSRKEFFFFEKTTNLPEEFDSGAKTYRTRIFISS